MRNKPIQIGIRIKNSKDCEVVSIRKTSEADCSESDSREGEQQTRRPATVSPDRPWKMKKMSNIFKRHFQFTLYWWRRWCVG
jgi:hypothetical protein